MEENKIFTWFKNLKNLEFGKMEGHSSLVFTWPNFLTFLRLVSIGLAVYYANQKMWLTSLIIVIIGAITDYFDGWLARRQESLSALGAAMDPIADKALLLVLFVINPLVCIAMIAIELMGTPFSNSIRKKRGGHFVAFGSKDITMYQFIIIAILYLNKAEIFNSPENLEIILLTSLVVLSLSRFSIYRAVYWSERES